MNSCNDSMKWDSTGEGLKLAEMEGFTQGTVMEMRFEPVLSNPKAVTPCPNNTGFHPVGPLILAPVGRRSPGTTQIMSQEICSIRIREQNAVKMRK